MSRSPRSLYPVRPEEVSFSAVRAQGAGGQNVNKVSSAVHLRYVVADASLPDEVKARLLALPDQRITKDGVVVIKSQVSRQQAANREDALRRLQALVDQATRVARARKATRPGPAAVRRRLDSKARHSQLKAARGRVAE